MVFSKLFDDAQRKRKRETDQSKSTSGTTTATTTAAATYNNSNEQSTKSQQSSNRRRTKAPKPQPPPSGRPTPSITGTNTNTNAITAAPSPRVHHFKKERPSFAKLEFSAKLKDLSRQKKMDEITALYWNRQYDSVRDEHHACIVIDCCARCGAVAIAEDIVAKLNVVPSSSSSSSQPINIETLTALLKVYVHAGMMQQAAHLFRTTISNPNVRTLNTLLRGCLWSAAATAPATHATTNATAASPTATTPTPTTTVVGGVITSEEAWNIYQNTVVNNNNNNNNKNHYQPSTALDESSYEYSIVLLCQALRVRDAEHRIEQFCKAYQIRVKGKASITGFGNDQSALETLAVVYLALARAYALLKYQDHNFTTTTTADMTDTVWRACQRSLSAIKASRAIWLTESTNAGSANVQQANHETKNGKETTPRIQRFMGGASGGKRGWKTSKGSLVTTANESNTVVSSDRTISNATFRLHRLSELEADVLAILKRNRDAIVSSPSNIALRIRNRLLFFTGGATSITERDNNIKNAVPTATSTNVRNKSRQSKAAMVNDHLVSSWYSFGLSQLTRDEQSTSALTAFEINDRCGLPQTAVIQSDGKIDFSEVFLDSKRPLDIEIGAGFGSWIVEQAQENKERNYVAIELRADRCFQIFSRATLEASSPLDNVCVVGSECCGFLRDRIRPSSVSTIYANFPEPPTQIYGNNSRDLTQIADGHTKEPSHMLHSPTIIAMGKALLTTGKIIIVSDNRSYARLLAMTLVKVVRENKGFLRSVPPSELSDDSSSLQHWETFANVVDVYTQNNGVSGTSYFDRLWQTGAGRQSEKSTRFVILMKRL